MKIRVEGKRTRTFLLRDLIGEDAAIEYTKHFLRMLEIKSVALQQLKHAFKEQDNLEDVTIEDVIWERELAKVTVKTYVEVDKQPFYNTRHIDGALLNTLLCGKLLTNEEKRQLLEQQGISFKKENEE